MDRTAGQEGLAWGERAGLQQRHPSPQQHPPHHYHQVQAPGPRHRRPRRPPRYVCMWIVECIFIRPHRYSNCLSGTVRNCATDKLQTLLIV